VGFFVKEMNSRNSDDIVVSVHLVDESQGFHLDVLPGHYQSSYNIMSLQGSLTWRSVGKDENKYFLSLE